MSSTEEMKIPLRDILTATNKFSDDNIIAKGGFGFVYKGILEKHGIVAIKRFVAQRGQGDHEFQTEIILHSKLTNENISSLYGFCDDNGEKILVYKYESNGSLDKHLNNGALTWIQRLRICVDAASGLKYIHDDVEPYQRVFHRDVKSSNILLDDDWNAKISDFGLSKLCHANMESTFLMTDIGGTIGYIDPEFLSSCLLTQKSDVFSFGVVLFEVLCGRTACVKMEDDSRPIFYIMVQRHFKNRTLDKIIPSYLLNQIDVTSLLTFSTIAYQCLMNGEERPTMKTVVEKLKKALDNQLRASQGQLLDLYDGAHHQTQFATTTSSSDSASTTCRSKKYDVFLSFSGEDTRKTFVDHLYMALNQQRINTYKDDEKLDEPMFPSLLKAIKESHIVAIVFSKNYADSSRCLDDLSYIMKCRDMRGQIVVIPIFLDMDLSDIEKQKSRYEEALERHELFGSNKVELWRKALVYASNLKGWASEKTANGDERFIQEIVYAISHELLRLKESVGESANTNLIGIHARIHDLKPYLELRSGGVHMVGICGIWGSGKSALASTIYDEISNEFEGCCFVKNVCAESRMYGLKALQEKILSDVLRLQMELKDIYDGIFMMENKLCNNKVLIVLDNVDHIDHLEMLAGSRDWFGDGSRIIFTTRNQDLLNAYNVNKIHNVRMLDNDEAIELFSRCAFGPGQSVESQFKIVSVDIISWLGGHPALLINLGSFLHRKHMNDWLNTLARIEGISIDKILKMYQVAKAQNEVAKIMEAGVSNIVL